MGKKLTQQEFERRLEEKYPGKYTILGKYETQDKMIRVKYNDCGHYHDVKPGQLLTRGTGCPICIAKSRRRTHEEFKDIIETRYPGKYTLLSEYTTEEEPITVRYNDCGHEVTIDQARYLLRGDGCGTCRPSKRLTTDYIRKYISDNFDGYELVGEYINNKTNMMIRHKCGCEFPISSVTLLRNHRCNCPVCTDKNKMCIPGYNDIHTTNVYLFNLLKNKDDGYKYREASNAKVDFICPGCGRIVNQKINSVRNYGVNCSICRSSYSYAERFMASLLEQLGVGYINQFSPDWANSYRYDFNILIDNKIIIEMDGAFHYENNSFFGTTAEDQQRIDQIKEELARDHGYTIIRIDCNYKSNNRSEYIKQSILHSQMNDLFDLSVVDWDMCNYIGDKSLTEIIVEKWNSDLKTVNQICDVLKLSDTTVRRRLYDASLQGIIAESIDEIKRLNRERGYKIYGHPQEHIIRCDQTGEIFVGYKKAIEKYGGSLANYFKDDNRYFCGTMPDGTRLTWTMLK